MSDEEFQEFGDEVADEFYIDASISMSMRSSNIDNQRST